MRWIEDDSGLTLTELIVVSILIGVILTAAYFMLNATQTMSDSAMARSNATDDAQLAIDKMTRELRQAQPDRSLDETPTGGVFKVAANNEIVFMSDLDHDMRPELIRYYVESNSLKRAVAPPTNAQAPFTFGTYGAPTVLIKQLGASAYPIFCFHTRVGDDTTVCGPDEHGFKKVTTSDPYNTSPKIAMVGILLYVPGTSGSKTVTVATRALVRIRTMENEVE